MTNTQKTQENEEYINSLKDEISYLRLIQSNRNGIHSFQHREMGNWNDLQFSVRFFCYLLEWVLNHLPDIPDYE